MRKLLFLIVAVILLPALYLLFWPTGMQPVAWKAPAAPALEGRFASNKRLAEVEWLARGAGIGPEDVAIDNQGRIYAGYHDGRILRFSATGEEQELFANTKGRPLGLEFAPDGTLVVADAKEGLLAVRSDGSIRVLATEARGLRFAFTDDLDIAADGTIYFSDASSKWGYGQHMQDILEHGGFGRLIRYHPIAGTAEVLLEGLQFANGVALAKDESYVLVNETGSYRVMRYWLKGDKAGTAEVFIDNLPGLPDGISTGDHCHWLALYSPRSEDLDRMAGKPFLRQLAARLPSSLQPKPKRHAMVLGLDSNGEVIHNLQDPSEHAYAPITSVEEHEGQLYLGSLLREAIGRIDAPVMPAYMEPDDPVLPEEMPPQPTETTSGENLEVIEEDGGDDVPDYDDEESDALADPDAGPESEPESGLEDDPEEHSL